MEKNTTSVSSFNSFSFIPKIRSNFISFSFRPFPKLIFNNSTVANKDFDGVNERREGVPRADNNDHHATISNQADNHEVPQSTAHGGINNCTINAMINYFNSIDTLTVATSEKREALAIIIDRINNASESRAFPDDLFTNSNSRIVKAIVEIILGRIPRIDRISATGSNAKLKRWMEAKNAQRLFMYHNKTALIRIAASCSGGMKLVPNMTYDVMISKLITLVQPVATVTDSFNNGSATTEEVEAGGNPSYQNDQAYFSMKQEIMKAMLAKSFMRPLKGRAKEYCSLGHKLELPVAMSFMRDANKKDLFHGFNFRFEVISLHKTGLVAKKNKPWAKDSIDLLAFVKNEEYDNLELWGIEIKSRVTANTVTTEREYMRRTRRRKYEQVSAKQAHRFVRDADERFQLLHHAYVYGLDRIVHLAGTKGGQVLSGTLIEMDKWGSEQHDQPTTTLLESYDKVIDTFKNIGLFYAYDATPSASIVIPDDVVKIAEDIPMINGIECLYGALKLWKVMFHNPSILPLPILKRIIPSTHAKWNACKSCSDTTTKIVDDCYLRPPRIYSNFESVAVGRCFSNLLATIFKLHQLNTANHDLDTYSCLSNYRNAASHRFTFKQILTSIYQICKVEGKASERLSLVVPLQSSENSPQAAQIRPRRRAYGNSGTIPDYLDLPSAIRTFKTPKRYQKAVVNDGRVEEHIIQRTLRCTGDIAEIVCQDEEAEKRGETLDPRRRCYVCAKKTRWQCLKCHYYFCVGTKAQDYWYINEKVSINCDNDITRIIRKSCFRKHHCDNNYADRNDNSNDEE